MQPNPYANQIRKIPFFILIVLSVAIGACYSLAQDASIRSFGAPVASLPTDRETRALIASYQKRAFHKAVAAGDLQAVRRHILAGEKIESANPQTKSTALHLAVHHGHLDILALLLRLDANLEAANMLGSTPLMIAAQNGDHNIVKRLLDAGASVRAIDLDGRTTASYYAPLSGNPKLLRTVVEAGGKMAVPDKFGMDGLFRAVDSGNEEILKLALEETKDANRKSEQGLTPLLSAVQAKDAIAIRLLVRHGADPSLLPLDLRRNTPADIRRLLE